MGRRRGGRPQGRLRGPRRLRGCREGWAGGPCRDQEPATWTPGQRLPWPSWVLPWAEASVPGACSPGRRPCCGWRVLLCLPRMAGRCPSSTWQSRCCCSECNHACSCWRTAATAWCRTAQVSPGQGRRAGMGPQVPQGCPVCPQILRMCVPRSLGLSYTLDVKSRLCCPPAQMWVPVARPKARARPAAAAWVQAQQLEPVCTLGVPLHCTLCRGGGVRCNTCHLDVCLLTTQSQTLGKKACCFFCEML